MAKRHALSCRIMQIENGGGVLGTEGKSKNIVISGNAGEALELLRRRKH